MQKVQLPIIQRGGTVVIVEKTTLEALKSTDPFTSVDVIRAIAG